MDIIKRKKKCAVCGVESEYDIVASDFAMGYNDLDLKPNTAAGIGFEISECPNCHYCNYDISNTIEKRFLNNLELWKSDNAFKELMTISNDNLRKILIVCKQYLNNCDYYNAYKHYIKASWVCENKEEACEYQRIAVKYFFEKIFNMHIDDIIQIIDLSRMNKANDIAKMLLNMLDVLYQDEAILDEDDKFKKVIVEAEKELISKGDIERHNIGEFISKD